MRICSFLFRGSRSSRLGILMDNDVADLTAKDADVFSSLNSLISEISRRNSTVQEVIESDAGQVRSLLMHRLQDVSLRIPLVPPEVWASGITYIRSKEAREVETTIKGLYNYIYDAERPELFFKATGGRCVGPGEEIGIRTDSKWSVPEPELCVVLGKGCSVIGYTIGNDMSARDIEGMNPLYLPQAKIFKKCCAIGPVVTTADEIPDCRTLNVHLRIIRQGSLAYEGRVSTSNLKRSVSELLSYLGRSDEIPEGSVLMTGTGIVPPDDFSLRQGDLVEIEIEKIGKLVNTVVRV
jgi:2-dehydro-3-deoxy-D-arabinonate dehydratase